MKREILYFLSRKCRLRAVSLKMKKVVLPWFTATLKTYFPPWTSHHYYKCDFFCQVPDFVFLFVVPAHLFFFSCTSSAISSLAWFSPDRVSNPLSSKSKGVGNLARFPLVSSFFIGCHHCCWYSTWGCRRDSLCFRNHTEKKNSYLWTFLKVSSEVWKIK